jgi:Txe/YoeB family toxin of Txe-Axe toxin-antitoxin module
MKKIVLLLVLTVVAKCIWASDIKVCQTEKAKYKYRIELANLILSKTADLYGSAEIISFHEKDTTQRRCIRLLLAEKVDFVYLPATEERLKKMTPIKIDIHNGMLGYRVLIINKKDKNKFSNIKTLEDLRKVTGGFGSHWGDFNVFSLNNLPVYGAANTDKLLEMLTKNRFDYFHRGLHEAWVEVEANIKQFKNIQVEESIALVYDFPVYFMFNKKNTLLKKRFEDGFEIILKDGSFEKLYKNNFEEYARKANLKNRTLIRIKYPTPKALPLIDTSLWLN